jgi:hypothetical protein
MCCAIVFCVLVLCWHCYAEETICISTEAEACSTCQGSLNLTVPHQPIRACPCPYRLASEFELCDHSLSIWFGRSAVHTGQSLILLCWPVLFLYRHLNVHNVLRPHQRHNPLPSLPQIQHR